MFLIMMGFALPGILYCYLFSYKTSSAGAFTSFLTLSLFVGMILTFVIQALIMSGDAYYEDLGVNLKYALLFLPPFGVSYCVLTFARKAAKNHQFDIMVESERERSCWFHDNPCCEGKTTKL